MFLYFLIYVDLLEWFEDLIDDNVFVFKDVSIFKFFCLVELILMKFIELSYKDFILYYFYYKEKIKYWFFFIIIIINILFFYCYLFKLNWLVWKKKLCFLFVFIGLSLSLVYFFR